jgi:hypothetical protein
MHRYNYAYFKFLDKNIIIFSNASPRLLFWIIVLYSVDVSKDLALCLHLFQLHQYNMKELKEAPIDVNVS